MQLSINKNVINKNINKVSQAYGFDPVDITPKVLSEYIHQGYCFSYQYKKAHRKIKNFICSDFIAADIDDGMTLNEAKENAFIQENASFIYTTANHTDEANRFRIVFQLPYTIYEPEIIKVAQQGLAMKLLADRAAIDAARQFYGNTNAQILMIGNIISEDSLHQLIKLGEVPVNLTDNKKSSMGRTPYVLGRSTLTLDKNTKIKLKNGQDKIITEIPKSTTVFCPVHEDKHPSAFTTRSSKGDYGIHCSVCQKTFWIGDSKLNQYDFYAFDNLVRKQNEAYYPHVYMDEIDGIEYTEDNNNHIFSSQYLSDAFEVSQLKTGVTFIKSPKGSGKTQFLKKVIANFKKQKLSILLVGHRRMLIKALAKEFGFDLYLDDDGNIKKRSIGKYYAVSIDSIAKVLQPSINKFDVIIFDESEQVFSHILSDTIRDEAIRKKIYLFLEYYIKYSKYVIALDADLNSITLEVFRQFQMQSILGNQEFILNEWKVHDKKIDIYENEYHLDHDLLDMIECKKRLFVCCNSKTKANVLENMISKRFPSVKLFKLTSDNVSTSESIEFVQNIKKEILNYQVVVVSPVIGSGIDIAFDDCAQEIDCVIGFYIARIGTHHDIDQQLSRVRNPKETKVWISPEPFNFEIEREPIKQDLIINNVVSGYVEKLNRAGLPPMESDDGFLNLYATILASSRASKNSLRENFVKLKQYNGWEVEWIKQNQDSKNKGKSAFDIGKQEANKVNMDIIISAKDINDFTAFELDGKKEKGSITQEEKIMLRKHSLKNFYKEEVTPELIQLDDDGRFLTKISTFNILTSMIDLDAKHSLLKEAFKMAGILDDQGQFLVNTFTKDSLNEFAQFCQKNSARINRIFNMDIRKDIEDKPTSQLSTFLKMCGLKLEKIKTEYHGKGKVYCYQISSYALALMQDKKKLC